MKQGIQAASLTLFFFTAAFAQQAPSPRPVFEVASIRPADPNGRGQFQLLPGGTVIMRSVTLRLLIQQSYDVRDFQISGGPAWMGSERYDITAKPGTVGDQRASSLDQMRLRLQALLADRFQLKLHRETKELPVFALVVAKDGPKLKESPANSGEQGHLRRGRGQLIGQQASMRSYLKPPAWPPGPGSDWVEGSYDFELNWTPDTPAGPCRAAGTRRESRPRSVTNAGPKRPSHLHRASRTARVEAGIDERAGGSVGDRCGGEGL